MRLLKNGTPHQHRHTFVKTCPVERENCGGHHRQLTSCQTSISGFCCVLRLTHSVLREKHPKKSKSALELPRGGQPASPSTMRLPRVALQASLFSLFCTGSNGFSGASRGLQRRPGGWALPASATNADENCGCGGPDTIVSGSPTTKAKALNLREAIREASFLTLDGSPTNFDELLGQPSAVGAKKSGVSVVVMLRSFG